MDTPAPPPPYSVQPQQIPVPISTLIENGHTQIISEKQNVNQYGQPLPEPVASNISATAPVHSQPHDLPTTGPASPSKPTTRESSALPATPSTTHEPTATRVPPSLPPAAPSNTPSPTTRLRAPIPSSKHPIKPQDAHKTGAVKRFFGDTLLGRVARSSVYTVTTTMKMPTSLSPWGDNNPVTLPNVRYRDAILFTTFAFVGAPLVEGLSDGVTSVFGADSFISEVVASGADGIVGSTVVKYGVFKIVEQAIDKGIMEHLLPEEERMLTTTGAYRPTAQICGQPLAALAAARSFSSS
ncbi:hypothetical protein GRF29_1536g1350230 [Pseudopithomyces chartarum]|uniref:Uncharacterized protein n=1 Tax=Pseudopithomyces chartarum TaxID=1892770 RepID=A0AAN6RAQ0_9PLEO|nr:hypothetical protein GRF29_1536g1350230 [Pseudopithomyces chartarum]